MRRFVESRATSKPSLAIMWVALTKATAIVAHRAQSLHQDGARWYNTRQGHERDGLTIRIMLATRILVSSNTVVTLVTHHLDHDRDLGQICPCMKDTVATVMTDIPEKADRVFDERIRIRTFVNGVHTRTSIDTIYSSVK